MIFRCHSDPVIFILFIFQLLGTVTVPGWPSDPSTLASSPFQVGHQYRSTVASSNSALAFSIWYTYWIHELTFFAFRLFWC